MPELFGKSFLYAILFALSATCQWQKAHAGFLRCADGFSDSPDVRSFYQITPVEASAYREHVVFDHAIMPAASYIAIALSELAQSGEGTVTLGNAKISSIYRLGVAELPNIGVEINDRSVKLVSESENFHLSARRKPNGQTIPSWVLPENGWTTQSTDARLSADFLYNTFFRKRVGLTYGPRFRALTGLEVHEGSNLVRASLVGSPSPWVDLVIDPGVLDSALQAVGSIAMLKNGEGSFSKPAIPVKFGKISAVIPPDGRQISCKTVIVRITAILADAIQYDLIILDDSGSPVFSITGGILAEVDRTQIIPEAS